MIYKNIKAIREDNDLTQKQMAELLNITVRRSRQSGVARATCPD